MLLPRRTAFALLLALCVSGQALAQAPATLPEGIDGYVARVMKTFDVPGVSLTVVKDGKTLLARGYGVRRLGEPAAVDAETLFGIASNTKVFTAAALGILVDEKKIEWDAPVIRYLPWFHMYDPFVTRELTVRDLLVHRSGLGLGAGDLLWWPESTYTRREIAERLQFIKPVTSFRSAYAYDNVLYLIAGEVIEAVSGTSWESFITSHILTPAGMTMSNVTHSAAAAPGGNVAATHAPIDGVVKVIRPFISDNTNPAGGINANAVDMAKWMNVLLAGGQLPGGTRLYSPAVARELMTIVTPLPPTSPPAELAPLRSTLRGYALGLNVQDYRGRRIVTHTGGLPGYVSRVLLVPDLGLGISVLTNQESGEAFNAIAYGIADHFLGAERFDWIDAFERVRARQLAAVKTTEGTASSARDASSKPSLPLASYAGTYRDAWYGDIAITEAAGRLRITFSRTPALTGALEHWQHDTFVARWDDAELRADAFVTFALTPEGTIEQAKMRAVSPATDFSFDFHDLLLIPVRR